MKWREKLGRSVDRKRTILCVGLDTDMTRFDGEDQFNINRRIIDATHEYAAAYKLNMAFYEAEGPQGMENLKKTVDHIAAEYPDILTILDGKKGDIGNTSRAYARAAFSHLDADSVTINGYMGRDAVEPFSEDPDRLCFVLCRTSNSAASSVQDFGTEGGLFMHMARLVAEWNTGGNLGMVVGATYPNEMKMIRDAVGFDIPLLVPGIGAQGGDLEKVLENGTDQNGSGLLINVSRGIMFAFRKDEMRGIEMEEASRKAAKGYMDMIKEGLEGLGRW